MNLKRARAFRAILLLCGITIILSCSSDKQPVTIYTIGDSTMADKASDKYPETGWCQVLEDYFDETVTVKNHARNGRSSKSFIEEGRWQVVLDSLKPGDFVFIQFGHNDQKQYDSTRYTIPFGTYTENLERYVKETRESGAEPILFTSIVRRKFGENGKLVDTHGDYPEATRLLAERLDVQLIDLQKLTEQWVNSMGDEPSKKMFLWTAPDSIFPEGRKDDTHLSEEGAHHVAHLALEECLIAEMPFANRIELRKE